MSEAITATVDVGGVPVGRTFAAGTESTEVLKQLLSPDQPPSVDSFTATPPFGLRAVGDAVAAISLEAAVSKGTADIVSVELSRLPNHALTTNDNLADGGTVAAVDSEGIDNGIRGYRVTVTDENGLTAISEGVFEFAFPVICGSVDMTNPTSTDLLPLDMVWTQRTLPSGNWRSICYAPNKGLFVVVGDAGGAMFSPDGINWTFGAAGLVALVSVCYAADIARANAYAKVAQRREAWQWEKAHELCKQYAVIKIEDLCLLGMKRLWGHKFSDSAIGEFVRKLIFVASKYDTKVIKVDRFFASSHVCSHCNHKLERKLGLLEREWQCPHCGVNHDRDVNAAMNIKCWEPACDSEKPGNGKKRSKTKVAIRWQHRNTNKKPYASA